MATYILLFIVLTATFCTNALPRPEVELITKPKPGEEYVFVQSTGADSRPIERKDKVDVEQHKWESSHKIPQSLTFALNQHQEEEEEVKHKDKKTKVHKRAAGVPAPAGAIRLDVKALLEKYKHELATSTTAKPKATPTTRKSSKRPTINRRPASALTEKKRIKKQAISEDTIVTTPNAVLTTDIPAKSNLQASGSEKQRSRIQIKKGPNGQEYEYEYVYYYYDDEDDKTGKASKTPEKETITNAHDGPARNQITQAPPKGDKLSSSEKGTSSAEANEVLPSGSGRVRTRGRQIEGEEPIAEERLPVATRFPPRSRNLNTTPTPEEETKTNRSRGRGRPTTETVAEADSVSDETQGSRGRTRANVKRPSLELVDSASFNTHSNTAGAESRGPTFPAELPAGPQQPQVNSDEAQVVNQKPQEASTGPGTTLEEASITTSMSPMDKVALDLYALTQGTQKLSGEDVNLNETDESNITNDSELTTVELTTVEATTPSTTTTTTTTTTTPTPTTTTTEAAGPFGKSRYRGRTAGNRKVSSSTTEGPTTESGKPKRFGANRPGFGNRPRIGTKTTEAPAQEEEVKESKAKTTHKANNNRSRFGTGRSRTKATSNPEENEESQSSTAASAARPSLRPRPTFNVRGRSRPTPATSTTSEEGQSNDIKNSEDSGSTTPKSRRLQVHGSNVRPLRPGPRINLTRGRLGAASTTEANIEDHATAEGQTHEVSEHSDKEPEASTSAPDNTPLGKLRNRQRGAAARPKASTSSPAAIAPAASSQAQVRRPNPLIGRRRPGQTTEAPASSEAPVTEAEAPAEDTQETEASPSSSTTEEPKGLNKLLAGRRRLANRQPGTLH